MIIGASSGIGQYLAHTLSGSDNRVYGTFCKNELNNFSENLSFHYLNVEDQEFNLDFLPEKLDGLVYCPGAINLKPFHRTNTEDYLKDYTLQFLGAVKTIQAVLPRLKSHGTASIVLFSTIAVQKGFNFHSIVASSKGAIEGLTKSLAAEFAPNIRVNCIAPSITDTPLAQRLLNTKEKIEQNENRHPLKKIGSSKNVAELAAFLLSDNASWMTGQIISLDGGLSTIVN